ncbi:Ribonuclease III domain [Pseudocohnilembus persalinus]|uniref:Ribonuclease III domain n=1 Tax=Pseudocohnilembus persalinus TaxID=266149 RepID=A0A0V0QNF9_PSEPJ|nr:Ribonuclease III domain [Pseudocohnilembus persalinus]|eukprot:KRX03703.1 Ribonuclease III domain [Pseudocohnilembus persalinus]
MLTIQSHIINLKQKIENQNQSQQVSLYQQNFDEDLYDIDNNEEIQPFDLDQNNKEINYEEEVDKFISENMFQGLNDNKTFYSVYKIIENPKQFKVKQYFEYLNSLIIDFDAKQFYNIENDLDLEQIQELSLDNFFYVYEFKDSQGNILDPPEQLKKMRQYYKNSPENLNREDDIAMCRYPNPIQRIDLSPYNNISEDNLYKPTIRKPPKFKTNTFQLVRLKKLQKYPLNLHDLDIFAFYPTLLLQIERQGIIEDLQQQLDIKANLQELLDATQTSQYDENHNYEVLEFNLFDVTQLLDRVLELNLCDILLQNKQKQKIYLSENILISETLQNENQQQLKIIFDQFKSEQTILDILKLSNINLQSYNQDVDLSYHSFFDTEKNYFSTNDIDLKILKKLENTIGYSFKNKFLLIEALNYQNIGELKSYQKLEFLGDSALEPLVIGAHENQPKIIADLWESLCGALLLDGGWEALKQVALDIYKNYIIYMVKFNELLKSDIEIEENYKNAQIINQENNDNVKQPNQIIQNEINTIQDQVNQQIQQEEKQEIVLDLQEYQKEDNIHNLQPQNGDTNEVQIEEENDDQVK